MLPKVTPMPDGSAQVWHEGLPGMLQGTGNNTSQSCIGRVREGYAGKHLSA